LNKQGFVANSLLMVSYFIKRNVSLVNTEKGRMKTFHHIPDISPSNLIGYSSNVPGNKREILKTVHRNNNEKEKRSKDPN